MFCLFLATERTTSSKPLEFVVNITFLIDFNLSIEILCSSYET